MSTRPCKVIIAGGGVAGLSLALMLEKYGIDFLLLEAYSDILPKAGGGLCMLPNGLRILDQLGCYEDMVKRGKQPVKSVDFRNAKGESLVSTPEFEKKCGGRYGYPLQWADRANLLQIVYEKIKNKSNILTSKRVETITRHADKVEVATKDGSVYFGDMIVGADGVHSRVRQEIHRHARDLGVGQEYGVDDKVPATYGCIFGISPRIDALPEACIDYRINKQSSTAFGSGPEDRTYWFFFKNLGRTYHNAEIPRLNENDLKKVIEEHGNEYMTPGVVLSEFYKTNLSAVYSAMREHVYKKWHLDRMMFVGDAAHSMTSILAQGASQALESAACVANAIGSAASASTGSGRLSTGEISALFEKVQQTRFNRVKGFVEGSHERLLMDCMETPELEDFMLNKFPAMVPNVIFEGWDQAFGPSVSLERLPVPKREKTFVYDDERSQEERARL